MGNAPFCAVTPSMALTSKSHRWMRSSGAGRKAVESLYSFEDYLHNARRGSGNQDSLDKSLRQIELDVLQRRTEPSSLTRPCVREYASRGWGPERRAQLANVLCAFSYRNVVPGYSQGMNFIVLLLLVVVDGDERAAFWLLCALVEDVRDIDFYAASGSNGMTGFVADTEVTKLVAQEQLGELSETMDRFEGDGALGTLIEMLAPKAFISLFCELLPLNCLLALWDHIFDLETGGEWPVVGLLTLIALSRERIEQGMPAGDMSYQAVLAATDELTLSRFTNELSEVRIAVPQEHVKRHRAQCKSWYTSNWATLDSVKRLIGRQVDIPVQALNLLVVAMRRRCAPNLGVVEHLFEQSFLEALDEANLELPRDQALMIFKAADREYSGSVDFRELTCTLVILARGSLADKLRLLFDTFDLCGAGKLQIHTGVAAFLTAIKAPPQLASKVRQKLTLLDGDGDGHVIREEFIHGCCADLELSTILGCGGAEDAAGGGSNSSLSVGSSDTNVTMVPQGDGTWGPAVSAIDGPPPPPPLPVIKSPAKSRRTVLRY